MPGFAGVEIDAPTVALVLSVVALVVSLTALWKTILKPAHVAIDLIDYNVRGGGVGSVPAIDSMSLDLAISNEGARAGVITRIDLKNVAAVGWPEFATGATEVGYSMPTLADTSQGGAAMSLPRTLPPGDVRTVRFRFKLRGAIHTAAGTTPEPDLTPIAAGLSGLLRVELEVSVAYRKAAMFGSRTQTEALETVILDGQQFRDLACQLWAQQGKNRLVGIAHGGPV